MWRQTCGVISGSGVLYAKAHNYAASIVFKWFNETFPDYRYNPKIDRNGKLIATVNVVSLEEFQKQIMPRDAEDDNAFRSAV